MHIAKKARRVTGTGTKDKVAVMGILQRGDKVVTTVVPPNRKKHALQAEVKKHVEAGSRCTPTCFSRTRVWRGSMSTRS